MTLAFVADLSSPVSAALGDVLVVMTDPDWDLSKPTSLWHLAPDGTQTLVGTTLQAFGAALWAAIPTTEAFAPGHGLRGAAALHDPGCLTSFEVATTGTIRGGAAADTASSIIHYTITGAVAYLPRGPASFANDLAALNPATSFIDGPLIASSGTATKVGTMIDW